MGYKPLGECVERIIDHRGLTPKKLGGSWSESGYRALSAKNIKDGLLVQEDAMNLVSEEMYRQWMPEEVKRGDVFITSEAPFGEVLYWDSDEKLVLSQRVFGLTAKTGVCNSRYLYYWMRSPQFQGELRGRATGTTVIGLRQPELLKCQVNLLPLEQQTAIACLLGAIDGKIALNNQINGYLGTLCESIAAKACSKPDGALSDICIQVTDKTSFDNTDIETYVSTESLLQNKGGRQTASSLPAAGKVTCYRRGDTLMSNIRPYFKKIWFASNDGTCSGDVLVFRANEVSNAAYLYSCLRQDSFFDHVMRGAKGTKMPRGDKKQVMNFPIAFRCDENDLAVLNSVVEQMAMNDAESARLAELCDALLPKLMSSEIDVSKVDLTQLNSHLSDC